MGKGDEDVITSEELEARLWAGADRLRGSMDASRYKDYMLGLMFYKFLSEKTLEAFKLTEGTQAVGEELRQEYAAAYAEDGKLLTDDLMQTPGFYILPDDLYDKWLLDIDSGAFELQNVIDALGRFERMIAGAKNAGDFMGLFSTMDLTDTALGANLKVRSENIRELIKLFADLHMLELQENDVIGDAYEYLIGQFAMESGKKAGEFYTPHQVSDVIARIIAHSLPKLTSIYDPCVGSGSLLLTVKYYLEDEVKKTLHYYGQEKNTATFNLTRMNLLLHDVKPDLMDIRNGDTLADDWPEDPARPNEGRLFDAVAMNPPYSLKAWNKAGLKVSDPRFLIAGTLPPDNKGDYAFLLHGLYHLGEQGVMAIVLPHGVLFRGAAEGIIRERLLEKNCIDAVIGLPANLFTNTGIPVIIMVLKKNRPLGEPVLMIDASRGFVKEGKTNHLRERDIARIVDTYLSRQDIAGYSHLATRQEILDNGCNLNIPRYVENLDTEIPHDVDAHLLGGIPQRNLKAMEVLQTVVPDIMAHAFSELRPGYARMEGSMAGLRESILGDGRLAAEAGKLRGEVDAYIGKYWAAFKELGPGKQRNLVSLRAEMLQEVKDILSGHRFMDVYSGYQVIADLWAESLDHDLKLMMGEGFYEAARSVEPNLVTKGSGDKKREEQDGWKGRVIPNDIVAEILYADRLAEIRAQEEKLQELNGELLDWVEKAGSEDSAEGEVLGDTLKEDKSAFDSKTLNAAWKEAASESERQMLKAVRDCLEAIKKTSKKVKEMELSLKRDVEERYPRMTEEEIDRLLWRKWFANITEEISELVREPFERELDLLETILTRYGKTVGELDAEIAEQEKEFEALAAELVVTE